MEIVIKKAITKILIEDLRKFGIVERTDRDEYEGKGRHKTEGWTDCPEVTIDLSALTRKECEKLEKLLNTCNVHGCKTSAADIRKYLRASDNGIETIRARTVRQASWMLEHYFASLPHHIIFSEDEYGGKSHSGYYVGDVNYEEEKPSTRNQNYQPPYCLVSLWHIEKEYRHVEKWRLFSSDCLQLTCLEILAKAGYVPESEELMEKLRKETERYYDERDEIGKQFLASGIGVCDLDNALQEEDSNHWREKKLQLDLFERESRVVVDILKEREDTRDRDEGNGGYIDIYRWHNWNMRFHAPSEDEVVRHLDADEDTVEAVDVDVPVHPLLPCFDLKRQTRLRVHINNLVPYKYDIKSADRLILPERDWRMVNLLVDCSANTFQDIVANKGNSMSVLCVGPPGVGKTVTAEVFSEFKKRPLYTVQCSQLGMTATHVENNLGVVMNRANRWNAVLLLDEADVYIRKRGTDLNQNAIVGAFLRVLEYSSCILFMTTNLGDEVDDAVTSRCIAKLTYEAPGEKNQAKIWKILADLNGLSISDTEITKICKKHSRLTGRDVKNLLKLASFIATSDKSLSLETIEYAMQFKPTEDFFKKEEEE